MSSAPVLALELMAEDGVHKWQQLLGPTDPAEARVLAPNSIRGRFGKNKTENVCHASESITSAGRVSATFIHVVVSFLDVLVFMSCMMQLYSHKAVSSLTH